MSLQLPSVSTIQEQLADLSHAEIHSLSRASSVPFTTLWNIRSGVTTNPGVETVRRFFGRIEEIKAQREKQPTGPDIAVEPAPEAPADKAVA